MHRPGIIFGIFGDVHDDFAQTASDAGLLDSAGKSVKAIAIGEL